MLEQLYWIAGIVAAFLAVIGLFRWWKKVTTIVNQSAKVSGQGNTVNQHSDSKSGDSDC
jgi:glycerol uptake facilitator-like aquaporin